VDTVAITYGSSDGVTFSDPIPLAAGGWSLWRIQEHQGEFFSAAYADGDTAVRLFRSPDGLSFSAGATIDDTAVDTPSETELVFTPSGKLLALVRLDGTNDELIGDEGRLRTRVCWADPPYDQFSCPATFDDARLDGPLAFFSSGRLIVVARKHLQHTDAHKRTAIYEIGGTLDGGPLTLREWGELPSGGDTAYAGRAALAGSRVLLSWYSGDPELDEPWPIGMVSATDIWVAQLDVSRLR
jgi:hypothetical protein